MLILYESIYFFCLFWLSSDKTHTDIIGALGMSDWSILSCGICACKYKIIRPLKHQWLRLSCSHCQAAKQLWVMYVFLLRLCCNLKGGLKSKYFSLCSQQDFFERLYVMYTIGYAVSFSSLLVAIFIIGYFRYESIFKYSNGVLSL